MVADFPLFEWNEEGQRLEAMHHPFTAPNPEDMRGSNGASLKTARALAYDLVYNGVEIAGRSPSGARASPCTHLPVSSWHMCDGLKAFMGCTKGSAARRHRL